MPPRRILTAHWTELLMLNFPVPVEAIASITPSGTEPDLHKGQAYISVIGFRFHAARLYGFAVPGHTSFPEINLRYYVRRTVGDEVRRGVVFVREIVPRRAVAFSANWLYHENYVTRPMRTTLTMQGPTLAPGDTLEYAWQSRRPNCNWPLRGRPRRGQLQQRWNRLAARVAAPLAIPATGSLEEFIVEHYWGYAPAPDGTTREYQVAHVPWQVAPADNVIWDCDLQDYSPPRLRCIYSPPRFRGGVRGGENTPLAEYLKQPPTSAIVADGSPIQVFRGQSLSI
jgi:uncharacterized protein